MCAYDMEVEMKLPRLAQRTKGRVEGCKNNVPNVNSHLYEDIIVCQSIVNMKI